MYGDITTAGSYIRDGLRDLANAIKYLADKLTEKKES